MENIVESKKSSLLLFQHGSSKSKLWWVELILVFVRLAEGTPAPYFGVLKKILFVTQSVKNRCLLGGSRKHAPAGKYGRLFIASDDALLPRPLQHQPSSRANDIAGNVIYRIDNVFIVMVNERSLIRYLSIRVDTTLKLTILPLVVP